jgi:hypothetical protein
MLCLLISSSLKGEGRCAAAERVFSSKNSDARDCDFSNERRGQCEARRASACTVSPWLKPYRNAAADAQRRDAVHPPLIKRTSPFPAVQR